MNNSFQIGALRDTTLSQKLEVEPVDLGQYTLLQLHRYGLEATTIMFRNYSEK